MFDPQHARPARGVPAAAAPAGHGEPVQRLLRRRLLLPRQPRPRGDPDHATATSGWSARPSGPLGPGFALERDYDLSGVTGRRRQALLGAARLVGPAVVRLAAGSRRARSTRARARSGRSTSASRSRTPSRWTRPAACTSSPTRRCTGSTPAAGGAPAVTWREAYPNTGVHKPGQVEPRVRHHADADRLRVRRDHRQRRPDERRGLQARQAR